MARPSYSIPDSVLLLIAREVEGSPGQKVAIIDRWARLLGVSRITIYRKLRRYSQWIPGKEIIHEAIKVLVLRDCLTTYRYNPVSTRRALRIAHKKGLLKRPLSPTVIYEVAKHIKWGKAKPAKRIKRSIPNALWAVDFTTLRSLATDGHFVYPVGELEGYHSNTSSERRRIAGRVQASRIWFGGAIDYATGTFWGMPYHAVGEDALTVAHFLYECFQPKDRGLCGLPQAIYTDQVTWAKTGLVYEGLVRLGIQIIRHFPGTPRAKGKIERHFRDIKRDFENVVSGWLRERDERMPWQDFIALTRRYIQKKNEDSWEKYKDVANNVPTIDFNIFVRTETRKVNADQTIMYDGTYYWAPIWAHAGQELEIFRIGHDVYCRQNGTRELLKPVEGDYPELEEINYWRSVASSVYDHVKTVLTDSEISDLLDIEPPDITPITTEKQLPAFEQVPDVPAQEAHEEGSVDLSFLDILEQNKPSKTNIIPFTKE